MVPPVILIPFTGLAALATDALKSPIILLKMVANVLFEIKIPFTTLDALVPDKS